MLPLLLCLTATAGEWTARLGAEVNADPHGVIDVAWRDETWQLGLYTDTLELRWQTAGPDGRAWAAVRGEAAAAGVMPFPWADGGPAPEQALYAHYGGVEGGVVRHLPAGAYAGVQGFARLYAFGATSTTAVPVPPARPVTRGEAVLGWWSPALHAWLLAGAHVAARAGQVVQPHLQGQAQLEPDWTVGPRVELRAGVADGQDRLTRTRLGGLNPYVVPLAGAAWGEWWVEDYAAVRAGPALHTEPVEVALVVDAAVFDGWQAVGLAVDTELRWRRLFLDTDVGWAPWIPRQPDVGRVSVWVAVGSDWGRGAPW